MENKKIGGSVNLMVRSFMSFILDFIKAYINIFKIGETNSPFVFILKIRTSTNQKSTKKTCTSVISTSCVTCISKQRTSQVPEIFNGISFRVCT